jgi:hypothetical protein
MAKDKPRPGLTELNPAAAPTATPDPEKEELLARVARLEQLLLERDTLAAQMGSPPIGKVVDADWAAWQRWAALSAQDKTALEADKRWGHEEGQRYRVQLLDHPSVIIPAPIGVTGEEAVQVVIARYNNLCGITGIAQFPGEHEIKHAVAPVDPVEV